MQRLLAGINPFARHSRSRSDQPLARLASSGGGASTSSGRSQPATPSDSTVGAAALLERSAACMQRAAEMKSALNTSILKAGKPGAKAAGAGAGASGGGGGGAGAAAPRGATPPASAGPSAPSSPSSGRRSSPSKTILSWMGLKGLGATPPEGQQQQQQQQGGETPPVVSLAADATERGAAAMASPRPLGEWAI